MRRRVPSLIPLGIFLLSGSAYLSPAYGQFSCQAIAVPPVARAESLSELIGDLVVTCARWDALAAGDGGSGGGVPSPGVRSVNLSVSLNVNITNNIDFGEGPDFTDAVLVVNENNCPAPTTTGSAFGDTAECAGTNSRFQRPQYGRLAAPNRLEWNGVSFPDPGVDPDGAGPLPPHPAVSTLRVTGLRGAAAQLGVPAPATFPSTQVTAFVSTTGIAVTGNVLNVAVPVRGLTFEPPSQPALSALCADGEAVVPISLRESFATALRTQGEPTFYPGTAQYESGYHAPGSNNGGGASQATRLLLRFFNIPQGVDVSAPNSVNTGSAAVDGDALWLKRVEGSDPAGAGGAPTATESGLAPVAINSGGYGVVVYEVLDADPLQTESASLEFDFQAGSQPGPCPGSPAITATLAPVSTLLVADGPHPEPRFLDAPLATPIAKIGVYRSGSWFLDNGNLQWNGCDVDSCAGFGGPGDQMLIGDFDGDGIDQIGFRRLSSFFLDNGNRKWDGCLGGELCMGLGFPTDEPLIGDWDGDGKDQVGVFRNGSWFLDNGNFQWDGCQIDICAGFGLPGDQPVTGDWNGDGKTEIGLFRDGSWFLDNGNFQWDGCQVERCYGLGKAGDIPIVGKFRFGSRFSQIGVFRAGSWFIDDGSLTWEGCGVDTCAGFGGSLATPLLLDYDGDGRDEIAIYDNGFWAIDDGDFTWEGCSVDTCVGLGQPGDLPAPGRW